MTLAQQIITIELCVLGTMTTRFLPFLVFRENRETPKFIQYVGNFLPSAVFGMLVVYCLRNVNVLYTWNPRVHFHSHYCRTSYLETSDAGINCRRNHLLYIIATFLLKGLCIKISHKFTFRCFHF